MNRRDCWRGILIGVAASVLLIGVIPIRDYLNVKAPLYSTPVYMRSIIEQAQRQLNEQWISITAQSEAIKLRIAQLKVEVEKEKEMPPAIFKFDWTNSITMGRPEIRKGDTVLSFYKNDKPVAYLTGAGELVIEHPFTRDDVVSIICETNYTVVKGVEYKTRAWFDCL